jgi:tRNA(fMet)-specific endonuclease VapC
MRTFLLDTCIWSYWFDVKKEQHAKVRTHLHKLPFHSILGISIITWGEIAYGHKVESPKETPIQAQYLQFVLSKGPKTFFVDDTHTARMYGDLRALLFKYIPKKKRAGLRPEQVVDPVTSLELGIQENDLWIAAQAMVRNLTLVTNEKLYRIREVAGDDLDIENWVT